MIIKQVSAFIENKKGRLCEATHVLAKNGIDISALSLADTAEFGVLRLIVNDPEKAKTLLKESGMVVRVSRVIAVAMDDVPGGAVAILDILSERNINIEYMYACVGKETGKALMVLRTDDIDGTEDILHKNGCSEISPADIYRI